MEILKNSAAKARKRLSKGCFWHFCVLALIGIVGNGANARAGEVGKNTLRLAYFMDVFVSESPEGEKHTQFEPWARAMVGGMQRSTPDAVVYESYDEFIRLMKSNTHNWNVCPMYAYDFIQLRHSCNLEALLVPESESGPLVEYSLYVPENSRITKLEDLANKNILFEIGGRGELPYFWFDNLMRRKLGHATGDIANIRSTATSMRAALPVFFGEDGVDACLLSSSGFEFISESNPQVGKGLRLLVSAPRMLTHVIACQRDLAPAIKEEIINLSLKLKPVGTSSGSKIRFSPFKAEYQQNIENEWLEWSTNSMNDSSAPPKLERPPQQGGKFLESRAAAAATPKSSAPASVRRDALPLPFRSPSVIKEPAISR